MHELEYFKGDELAASTWRKKYALKEEKSPTDMNKRLAREFSRIEEKYGGDMNEDSIFSLFEDTKIIPGGSVLSSLGTNKMTSLSNCFVVDSPKDSYASIHKVRGNQTHLMKRRGGVGYDLSKLRPKGAPVNNSAEYSTGAASFMNVCSEVTKEVAQGGRRKKSS